MPPAEASAASGPPGRGQQHPPQPADAPAQQRVKTYVTCYKIRVTDQVFCKECARPPVHQGRVSSTRLNQQTHLHIHVFSTHAYNILDQQFIDQVFCIKSVPCQQSTREGSAAPTSTSSRTCTATCYRTCYTDRVADEVLRMKSVPCE